MRILIVGAGALGGYFGARLMQAGRDVTFLVRPRRAAQLAKTGLDVRSKLGNAHFPAPKVVLSENIKGPYDLVIVGCKSYDLAPTMESFAPAVGPNTAVLPYLNGMKHMDALTARFGRKHLIGGLAIISATLDDDGIVHHLNEAHTLTYGELDGSDSPRMREIVTMFAGVNLDARATQTIVHELWEKWVFIASLAGTTCLMRALVGDVEKAGAADIALGIFGECSAIAASQGHAPRPPAAERGRKMVSMPGSSLTASMMKDMERGAPIEGEQIIGDLLSRGRSAGLALPLLSVVHAHLRTYEARRERERAENTTAS